MNKSQLFSNFAPIYCATILMTEVTMKSSKFLVLLVSLLLMASCSSVNDNLVEMIPDDALGVVSVNMPDILKKAGELAAVIMHDDPGLVSEDFAILRDRMKKYLETDHLSSL